MLAQFARLSILTGRAQFGIFWLIYTSDRSSYSVKSS